MNDNKVYYYKTRDGKAVFSFSYLHEFGYYTILIHSHPSYNGRDEASTIAHWLSHPSSPIDRKICFTAGKEPKSLEQAKNISMQYAELTWCYIRTGETIDSQIIRNN